MIHTDGTPTIASGDSVRPPTPQEDNAAWLRHPSVAAGRTGDDLASYLAGYADACEDLAKLR